MSKLSLIISVYNEEEALPKFYQEVTKVLNTYVDYELIFVNDGSKDGSLNLLRGMAIVNSKVKVISFAANAGHEAAMIAGIDYAKGDFLICMDADLQHPVSLIPDIAQKFSEGYDVVSMVRTSNKSAGLIKNVTSSAFYSVINAMSSVKMQKNASDFFGISKRVADVLRKDYREKVRFLRGYVQTIGFNKCSIEYEAADRVAGKSKYSIRKLTRFSLNTIMCFSDAPLKLGIYAGIFAVILGIIVAVYTIITWANRGTPSGYATIICLICFMFAVLFFLVGIIGEYISVLFTEIKNRPIYIVEETINED